jgi:hypothetical protein
VMVDADHLYRGDVELDASTVWAFTQFAKHLRGDADQLQRWADDIDERVETIWKRVHDA